MSVPPKSSHSKWSWILSEGAVVIFQVSLTDEILPPRSPRTLALVDLVAQVRWGPPQRQMCVCISQQPATCLLLAWLT